MKNDCLDAAIAELAVHGIRDVTVAHGGKHFQVRFSINGGPQLSCIVPVTPSDVRGPANMRRDVRKLLRENGVKHTTEKTISVRQPSRLELLERRIAALEQQLTQLRKQN